MLNFKQYLTEKLITLGDRGRAYPKSGHVVILAGGAGCHAKDTEILMFDGSVKRVQDIDVGDLIMGPDSKPRKVLTLHNGEEEMVEVSVNGREPFKVNRSHIHSFVASYSKSGLVGGTTYNMTYDQYMALTPTKRDVLKLYASKAIEFEEKVLPVDPYTVGCWLLDDERQSNTIKSHSCFDGEEKVIPEDYLKASIKQRKDLLAGLIGSDGYDSGKSHEIVIRFPRLKDCIVRLCRSLGHHVTVANYDRITISGPFTEEENGNRYSANFTVKEPEEYFGFEVDQDNLYVMGNYMVTHNSGKGFILGSLLGIEGKVFDVDALKALATGASTVIQRVKDERGIDLSTLDIRKYPDVLKNPDNVSLLHDIMAKIGLPNRRESAFFATVMTAPPDRKPNVIFDVTMKSFSKLENIAANVQRIGYRPENIHIVWVIQDIEVAIELNALRERVVSEHILFSTHSGASHTMGKVINMGNALTRYMNGDIVFAFNRISVSEENDNLMAKSSNPVDPEVRKSLGFGRKKNAGSYVKKSDVKGKIDYVYVKTAGSPPKPIRDLRADLRHKIAQYVPKGIKWE